MTVLARFTSQAANHGLILGVGGVFQGVTHVVRAFAHAHDHHVGEIFPQADVEVDIREILLATRAFFYHRVPVAPFGPAGDRLGEGNDSLATEEESVRFRRRWVEKKKATLPLLPAILGPAEG